MKKLVIILALLFIPAYSNYPKEEVGIYALDIKNDEEIHYRILKLVNQENNQQIKENYFLDLPKYADFSKEIDKIILEYNSNDEKLIGRDIALIFTSKKEVKMYEKVGTSLHCYLYQLKGYFNLK